MNIIWFNSYIKSPIITLRSSASEKEWLNYFQNNTPNGKILLNNKYLEYFQPPIRIVHITPSLNKILKSRRIFPSGGGLGSAIYGVPLDKKMHPHNLFDVYYSYQIPQKTKRKIGLLCFEIIPPKEKNIQANMWGVDYSSFGKWHLKTWKKIKEKNYLSPIYVTKLENKIANQIERARSDLNWFLDQNDTREIDSTVLKKKYKRLFTIVPAIRFILYEIICEYILLFQNNKESVKWAKKGELYNLSHKKLVFDLCPTMAKKFRMMSFFILPHKLLQYIKKKDIITTINEKDFYYFLARRISFYLNKICQKKLVRINNFKEAVNQQPFLVGHIIYREFFNKSFFEQELSEFIYKYEFQKNIFCPIYSILPKGEVGINPNIRKLGAKVNIYIAKYNKEKNEIILGKKVSLKIEKQIISSKKSTNR